MYYIELALWRGWRKADLYRDRGIVDSISHILSRTTLESKEMRPVLQNKDLIVDFMKI
jgi:hypothetical protein